MVWSVDAIGVGPGVNGAIFHAVSTGTTPVTITVDPGPNCWHGELLPMEYSGVTTLDVAGVNTDPSIWALAQLTLATSKSGELCVALVQDYPFVTGFVSRGTSLYSTNLYSIEGQSTGTSTTMGSTGADSGWSIPGACYK
jgi:hypothetical protein